MKKSLKIVSIITVLMLILSFTSLKVYATDELTPIPIETEGDITGGPTGETTITDETPTITDTEISDDKIADDKVAEDKIAEDKVLPDAGFDQSMIYIIAALILFAVFAYIKVVKYNLD